MYGVGLYKYGDFFNQLIKVDVFGKDVKMWYQCDCFLFELVFVVVFGVEVEDEGVIILFVVGVCGKKLFFFVFDGCIFCEIVCVIVLCLMVYFLYGMFRFRFFVFFGLCRKVWVEI